MSALLSQKRGSLAGRRENLGLDLGPRQYQQRHHFQKGVRLGPPRQLICWLSKWNYQRLFNRGQGNMNELRPNSILVMKSSSFIKPNHFIALYKPLYNLISSLSPNSRKLNHSKNVSIIVSPCFIISGFLFFRSENTSKKSPLVKFLPPFNYFFFWTIVDKIIN